MKDMEEIWKDIPDYESIYQVSNLGRVRTCEGKTTFSKKYGVRHWRQKILKPKFCCSSSRKGRIDGRLDLWKNGKHKTYLLARLVASAFYGKSDLTVNHIDGNTMNNQITNLEYVSVADNIRKGFEMGLYSTQKKIKLTNKNSNQEFVCYSMSKASKLIGCNEGYISSQIKKNKFENAIWKWSLIK